MQTQQAISGAPPSLWYVLHPFRRVPWFTQNKVSRQDCCLRPKTPRFQECITSVWYVDAIQYGGFYYVTHSAASFSRPT